MNKIIKILFLAALLLITSCSSSGGGDSSGSSTSSGFNGGDEAVVISFVEGTPDSVRDNGMQTFPIRLHVENVGEHDIAENEAHVTLTGFNPSELGLTDNTRDVPALRGYKKQGSSVRPGVKQQVTFENMKYESELAAASLDLTIYANICYPYQTKAFALLCINGDALPPIDDKSVICDIEGDIEHANSGGPIQIENAEQYSGGTSSIQFQFDIIHKPASSDATVYGPGSIDSACKINGLSPSSSDAVLERDKITYTVNTGIAGLDCEGTGTNTNTIQLDENARYTVFCTQDTTGQEEYPKAAEILLDYEYLDRISTDITIQAFNR